MFEIAFKNSSFEVFSFKQLFIDKHETVGYLIIPTYFSGKIVSFKYFSTLSSLFELHGISVIDIDFFNQIITNNNQNINFGKIQYWFPTIFWENLKKATNLMLTDQLEYLINLEKEENYQKQRLIILLTELNDGILSMYL